MAGGSNPLGPAKSISFLSCIQTLSLNGGPKMPRFNVMENYLVPRHSIMPEEEVDALLTKYGIVKSQLPKLLMADPSAKAIGAKPGDVVVVERESPTAGLSIYYRLVVEERSLI